MAYSNNTPAQLLPESKKGKKWHIDNIDHYCNTNDTFNRDIRKTRQTLNENLNLLIGVVDNVSINKQMNPLRLEGNVIDYPEKYDNSMGIILPTINTLLGEELKRGLEYSVMVINPDAISEKEKNIKGDLGKQLMAIMDDDSLSDAEMKGKVEDMQEWLNYDIQDVRELTANRLLSYYYEELKLKFVFSNGMEYVLAGAEEMYRIDIVAKEPRVTVCNPLNTIIIGLSESNKLEECEAIREETWLSRGDVIAEFGDKLTKADKQNLYNGNYNSSGMGSPYEVLNKDLYPYHMDVKSEDTQGQFGNYGSNYGDNVDLYKVQRVYWKSLRELYILTTIDKETGQQIEELLDAMYTGDLDANKGEKVEKIHVTEWYQGTKIEAGNGIYLDYHPCPVQRRDLNNPYISYPPFVGTVYNYGDRKARSIIDILKPYQLKWLVMLKRIEKLWSQNMGKLIRIDMSKIPKLEANMEASLNKFLAWIYGFGIILEDPFQEVGRGQQAGDYSSSVKEVDAELGSSIQQAINWLMFIQQQSDILVGMNDNRRGEGSPREGLGVTQSRIVRSSHQTEKLFAEHDYTKIRVLEVLLETAKYCYSELENKKAQYILDDLSISMLNMDVSKFKEADYGIKVMNTFKVAEAEQEIARFAEAALQAGTPIADILDIKMSDSVAAMIQKLRNSERKRERAKEEAAQAQTEQVQMVKQAETELAQMKHQFEMEKLQFEYSEKKEIEAMRIEAGAYDKINNMENDTNNNFINDNVEIEKEKLGNQVKREELKFKYKELETKTNAAIKVANIKGKAPKTK